MKLVKVGIVALTFTVGCVRFGYDARQTPTRQKPDAPHRDAGNDAAIADAGSQPDVMSIDAAMPDASTLDSGGNTEAGPLDAGVPEDAGGPKDSAMPMLDGGQTDADVTDAAVDDGAVDAGRSEFCPERSDALFCDGFEEDPSLHWSYSVLTNGTADRTTARYHSGAGSLHATTGAPGMTSEARYGAKVFGNQKSGEIWARTYYYIPSSSVANPYFSTMVVAEIDPPFFGFSLMVLPSRVDIAVGDMRYQGTTAFPRDRWTCVELHVKIDAAAGIFEAYLDGALVAQSPATDTLPDTGYTSVDVGIHYTSPAQGPVQLWVDDVVAGNTRIGCD